MYYVQQKSTIHIMDCIIHVTSMERQNNYTIIRDLCTRLQYLQVKQYVSCSTECEHNVCFHTEMHNVKGAIPKVWLFPVATCHDMAFGNKLTFFTDIMTSYWDFMSCTSLHNIIPIALMYCMHCSYVCKQ